MICMLRPGSSPAKLLVNVVEGAFHCRTAQLGATLMVLHNVYMCALMKSNSMQSSTASAAKSAPAAQGMPLIGDKFPQIEVQTTHGKMTLPDAFSGKWFVLFSHPADFTPVCTTEFVAFAKRYDQFKKLDCELIGLSIDQVISHMKWTEWIQQNMDVEIPFPIIADTGKVASMLGMIHPGKASNTVRAVFIVDPKSTVRLIIYYPQEVGRNMDEILQGRESPPNR